MNKTDGEALMVKRNGFFPEKKKILILSDRQPLQGRLINLGDRAMADGFCRVLAQNGKNDLISGGWKNFPFFNLKMVNRFIKTPGKSSSVEIERRFKSFIDSMEKKPLKRLRYERQLLRLAGISGMLTNPFISSVDNWFVKRHTRGLTETVLPFIFRLPAYHDLKRKIFSSDLVVFNGAALVSDHLDFYLPSYLVEGYLAKQLGKPVVTTNQSFSVKKPLNRKMVKLIYSMFDFHMTREPASTREMIGLGFNPDKLLTSCDTAFAADYKIERRKVDTYVRKNGLDNGGFGIAFRGDMAVDFDKLKALVLHLKTSFHKEVYYISTCKPHDRKLFRKLKQLCDIRFLEDADEFPLTTQLLKYLDLVITDRYHTSIFSIVAGTPVLPFKPQTHKLEGLFSLFDYPFHVESFNRVNLNLIKDRINEAVLRRSELSQKIYATGIYLKKKVYSDMRTMLHAADHGFYINRPDTEPLSDDAFKGSRS